MSLRDKVTILKYKNALKEFAEIYGNAPPKERHIYLYPLRSAGIKFDEAKNLGFNATSWS